MPGVPQHWTVQASRHVHWAKHPTDALADALADNSRADPVTDDLTDALAFSITDNTRADPVTDATRLRDCYQRKSLLIRSAA